MYWALNDNNIFLIANKSYLHQINMINPNAAAAWEMKLDIIIWYTFIQRRTNVFDVGPALYKCYTNVWCWLARQFNR